MSGAVPRGLAEADSYRRRVCLGRCWRTTAENFQPQTAQLHTGFDPEGIGVFARIGVFRHRFPDPKKQAPP